MCCNLHRNKGPSVSFRSACVSLFIAALLAMVSFITWQESLTAVQEGFRKHQKRSLDKEVTTTQMPIMTAKIHEENDKKHKKHKSYGKLHFEDSKTVDDEISQKMAAKHQQLIQPLTKKDEEDWKKKIWTTAQMESHADAEPVEILWWFAHTGHNVRQDSKWENHEQCGTCILTTDRSKEQTADAIVIPNGPLQSVLKHGVNRLSQRAGDGGDSDAGFPDLENRNLSQIWAFENKESAIKGSEQPSTIPREVDSAFNVTMTYRLDSDISRRFGDIESVITSARFDEKGELVMSDEDYARQLMANKYPAGNEFNTAWFVSNCGKTPGAVKRFEYGAQLIADGLKLYSEGECFGHATPKAFGKGGSELFPLKKLKFYLAFENAFHCNDYISEKFWRNSFNNELVPVVYGPHPDDVKAVAPPNSYILAEDFDSPKELVEYLEYLDKNNTAYMEYHAWRNLYTEGPKTADGCLQNLGTVNRTICLLCRRVREMRAQKKKQSIKSVMSYWKYNVHKECKEDVNFQDYQTKIKRNIVSWHEEY
ncbi:Oidioi.mRNA.OKI2018_I69.chr2.g6240.t1.cds [Oikopleura dioica]|uniref:Fucosyltransferase n=1 Tax=Oikopleura dioica TaxID=34765 RepID=A0ABN7T2T3_OIKDI|nr:Oidioi.mRNA.OKI2018_I69.chr2.g6240.t1.cds [Oikopleura dioica]